METIGDLVGFLRCFDPALPLTVLAVDGAERSELVTMSAMGVVGPVVARDAGYPSGVWLVARTRREDSCPVPPVSIGIERSGCGCLVEIPVVFGEPVATWGIECCHSLEVPSS